MVPAPTPPPNRPPRLTIAVPTRDRPDLLERAVGSIVQSPGGAPPPDVAGRIEIVICDNASDEQDDAAAVVTDRLLGGWPGPTRYLRHRPPVGMVENFNSGLAAAGGDYVLLLHDDDYLLPGGAAAIVEAIDAPHAADVLLFGVAVVDLEGRVLRRQGVRTTIDLSPADALRAVLTNSSLVRFPGMVVRRAAYDEVGPFDPSLGGPTDFDMWVRLFSRFGVRRVASTVAAYTVHPGAATTRTFTQDTIAVLMEIFERARRSGVLDEATIRTSQAAFFHQFILGGAYRSLRAGDRAAARTTLHLFQLADVAALGRSPRWLPVRAAFTAATLGAGAVRP